MSEINKRIDHVFIRFSAIYGQLWNSIYKTESFIALAKEEWRESLEKFDNKTLGRALNYCRQKESWPPTLPKFIEICKVMVNQNKDQESGEKIEFKCNRDVALQHIARMRAILKMA